MQIIDSITIRYFRSVYTLTLKSCKDLNVITGKNDVGKSNILKALNLFFNGETDYLHKFDFQDDYSLKRKDEVKKDTIRGQQFISIMIRFLRGDRMPNSLPPSFVVTKRWDMHSMDCKTTSDVQTRMQLYAKKQGIKYSEKTTATSLSAFLNRISFVYIPAIKDERVFNNTLDILQNSLFDSRNKAILDEPIGRANDAVQEIVESLQDDFQNATGIQNFVQIPNTLNYTNGLLQVNTLIKDGTISIDKRGDGIRTHFIPKILNYVALNSKKIFIWGFEEPENSYEYRRCLQVAEEFDKEYCKQSQIFITSHSPAFFIMDTDCKAIYNIGKEGDNTVVIDDLSCLDEELGYKVLYQEFAEKLKERENKEREYQKQLSYLMQTVEDISRITVLTEGKTDAALLRIAIKKLGLNEYKDWNIQEIISDKTSNNDTLLRHLMDLSDNRTSPALIIGMFDRDTPVPLKAGGATYDLRTCEFSKIGKNVFAFAIPVPHNRKETDQISIEHYFTDEEIKTEIDGKRLYMGYEFYETGVMKSDGSMNYKGAKKVFDTIKIIEHESKCYVTKADGSGDYSISKARFVELIEKEEGKFALFSFEEFRKIFKVLDRIKQAAEAEKTGEVLAHDQL